MYEFERIEHGENGMPDRRLLGRSRRFGVNRLFRGIVQRIFVAVGVLCIFQIIKLCIFGENDMSADILKLRIAELILGIGL